MTYKEHLPDKPDRHPMDQDVLTGFPLWLQVNHYLNFLFITLLVRSGIQILSGHPRLYWNEHCRPGSEWISFADKATWQADGSEPGTSETNAPASPWLCLPGGIHGSLLGRHWHFFSVIFWIGNGIIYLTLLFATGAWRRLLPTSPVTFGQAFDCLMSYLTFHLPVHYEGLAYDPLQQLTYAGVVFLMAPLTIISGAAITPNLSTTWTWLPRLFGGRERARSTHFLLLVLYLFFLVVHVSLVSLTGFTNNIKSIVPAPPNAPVTAVFTIGLLLLFLVVAVNIAATVSSHKQPEQVRNFTATFIVRALEPLFNNIVCRQQFDLAKYLFTSGLPPGKGEYPELARHGFESWRLKVHGLVEFPLELSLQDLMSLPAQTEEGTHCCSHGGNTLCQWTGVAVQEIIKRCRPLPNAYYLVFHSYTVDDCGQDYYTCLTLAEANSPSTILAYTLNGEPLPLPHGAPLRLKVETNQGFRMIKYLRAIEFVEDYRTIGRGQGGYRQDTLA